MDTNLTEKFRFNKKKREYKGQEKREFFTALGKKNIIFEKGGGVKNQLFLQYTPLIQLKTLYIYDMHGYLNYK